MGLAIYQEGRHQPFLSGLFLSDPGVQTYPFASGSFQCYWLTKAIQNPGWIHHRGGHVSCDLHGACGPANLAGIHALIEAFRKLSAGDVSSGIKGGLKRWQFVDLNSFLRATPGEHSCWLTLMAALVAGIAIWVAALFWKSATGGKECSTSHVGNGANLDAAVECLRPTL